MLTDRLQAGDDVSKEGMIFDPRFYAWDCVGFESSLKPEHKKGLLRLGIDYRELGLTQKDFESGKKRIIMKYAQFCKVKDCIDGNGVIVPERMYFSARYALFFSLDEGKSWKYGGIPIEPTVGDDYGPDSGVVWSGSFLLNNDGNILASYTGVAKKPPMGKKNRLTEYVLQNIMGAKSDDGGFTFDKIREPLVCAIRDYDKLRTAGYYLGDKEKLGLENDPDGTHMTQRDMQLIKKGDGSLWGYFAAKATSNKHKTGVEPCIGQVRFEDPNSLEAGIVFIGKPIMLPDGIDRTFNQLECPNILKNKQGETVVVVSLAQHWKIGQAERTAVKQVKAYKADELPDGSLGNLKPYGNPEKGENILLTNEQHGLYAMCTISNDNSEKRGVYDCAAFQVREDHKFQYPSIKLDVNGELPTIKLPDLEKYNEMVREILST